MDTTVALIISPQLDLVFFKVGVNASAYLEFSATAEIPPFPPTTSVGSPFISLGESTCMQNHVIE